jgi:threonine 3-dehydrogenase
MKVLRKSQRDVGLWMEEAPLPEIGPSDILIKIRKTAICGTDLHIYNWDEWAQSVIPVPIITGHEFFGHVEDVGALVTRFNKGDRVSGEGHIVCNHCRNCKAGKKHLCPHTIGVGVQRDGAFAEYLSMPESNVYKISDNISDDLASIFDPFGNATHTALSFDLVGENVLITGAGPIGCMAAAIAKHAGARKVIITDINDFRLELAQKLGADVLVNPNKKSLQEAMKEHDLGDGFGVGLEMSGNPSAFNQMLKTLNHGGKIGLLGILPNHTMIDWSLVIFKGLLIKGIYGREMFETWYKMSSMLESGLNISSIITHQFPIDEFQKGFNLMNKGQSGKVVLNWS